MTRNGQATFSVKSWEENTWDGRKASEVSGVKQTHAAVRFSYDGEIRGESEIHYLMAHHVDDAGSFIGLERIEGEVGGRRGSFILQHTGTFHGHTVVGKTSVVAGAGTGELAHLRGEGSYELVGSQERYAVTLEYDLE